MECVIHGDGVDVDCDDDSEIRGLPRRRAGVDRLNAVLRLSAATIFDGECVTKKRKRWIQNDGISNT